MGALLRHEAWQVASRSVSSNTLPAAADGAPAIWESPGPCGCDKQEPVAFDGERQGRGTERDQGTIVKRMRLERA